VFLKEVHLEANQRYPDWASGQHSLQKLLRDQPPRFGHAILRSITESYLVIAVTLLELEGQPVHDHRKFVASLLAQGEQMLLRRTISSEASVSQDLFSTGLRLVEHQQLLKGPADIAGRREAYAERVVTALSAINLLQRCYDAAWFSKLSAGRVSNLLGP
jgi:glycerol-3-phosphate O-acyltransferase